MGGNASPDKERGWLTAAIWVVLYGSVSILTTISTKSVVSGFQFKELTFMMLLERLAVIAALGATGSLPKHPAAVRPPSLPPSFHSLDTFRPLPFRLLLPL